MSSPVNLLPVHTAVKGRARFKSRQLRGNGTLATIVSLRLPRLSGISRVTVSSVTGSILVIFDPGLDLQQIESGIQQVVRSAVKSQELSPVFDDNNSLQAAQTSYVGAPWHVMDARIVQEQLGCVPGFGLTPEQARHRLHELGPNRIAETRGRTRRAILLDQINSLPTLLLSAEAIISVLTGGIIEAAALTAMLITNTVMGYVLERRTEKAIVALRHLPRPRAQVIRDGRRREVAGEALVVGDLILLKPGTFIGADCRIVESSHLKIDESVLTGESLPVDKTVGPLENAAVPLVNRRNMIYMGTLVVGGSGSAVVVTTGRETEYGRLHDLLNETLPPRTPLIDQLNQLTGRLVIAGGWICTMVFFLWAARGFGWLASIRILVALAASALPVGLPSAAFFNLALGIQRLKRSRVSIQRLYALETLGNVKIVCFDKTGTITRSRISVLSLYAGGRHVKIARRRFTSGGDDFDPLQVADLRRLLQACLLCNESRAEFNAASRRPLLKGSPTENALIHLAILSGLDVPTVYRSHPLIQVRHRSELRRYMVTVHAAPAGRYLVLVKGDPMEVLAMCDRQLVDGLEHDLDDRTVATIEIENERMAADALRVLGFACRDIPPGEETDVDTGLVWIGLVGMAEPIRKGMKSMIARMHRAGIETVMITGDQNATAFAVADRINLAGCRAPRLLDSSQFASMDPQLLNALTRDVQVFSRVNPAQKLQIVRSLQESGRVVAMTGDGINDGPALKAANIGVAMGLGGTDVARQVADMVLDRDDIATLAIAIEEGRVARRNLRTAIRYFLAVNFSEIVLTLTAAATPFASPLLTDQPSQINVIADIFPGSALLLDPTTPEVMEVPPPDPEEPLLSVKDLGQVALDSVVLGAGALTAFTIGRVCYGPGPRAATMAAETLTAARLLHALHCRRQSGPAGRNPFLALAIGGATVFQMATLLIPALRRLLGISRLSPADIGVIGASALLPLWINRRRESRQRDSEPFAEDF